MANTLAAINIFSGLDPDELDQLANVFSLRNCEAGEVLLNEGERGTSLNIVLEGRVDIVLAADERHEDRFRDIKLTTMGPGELFGEYGLIDMRPASASVRAVTACRILEVQYTDLHRLIYQHCNLGRQFYENLLLVLIDRLRRDDTELDLFAFASG